MPNRAEQRYSCHGCGECCRDFTIELRPSDFEKMNRQGWDQRLGESWWVSFAGRRWLKQRSDGACIFLGNDGRCRVHAEFGLQAKPIACQVFPFSFSPEPTRARIGVSFACTSVRKSDGESLAHHHAEIVRMQSEVHEATQPMSLPDLVRGVQATEEEVGIVESALDTWLGNDGLSGSLRLEGFAWIAQSLRVATLDRVRSSKLRDLLHTLVAAAPQELGLLDATPPSGRSMKLLRQAVFARMEDPKIARLASQGRVKSVLRQAVTSWRWSHAVGHLPNLGGNHQVRFSQVEGVSPIFAGPEARSIDELLRRWLRVSLAGGRAWGSGLYGLPINEGVALLALNAVCAAWIAQARAASESRTIVSWEDFSYAVGRVDRASGRAPWLGSSGERLRVQWMSLSDSLRKLARWVGSARGDC